MCESPWPEFEVVPDPIDATADVRFDPAYPWVVKSLRQSALLDGWLQQRRAAGAAPILAGFTALRSYRDQSELSVYQIVRESFVRYFVVQDGAASRSIFG